MLRCAKNFAMGLLAVVMLVAFAGTSLAAVEVVETYAQSSWSNTIYYIATLQGPDGNLNGYTEPLTIKVTAVDEYELYINGTSVGSGSGWETPEEWSYVPTDVSELNIGVKVINHGLGNGNGLKLEVIGTPDQLGTTTMQRMSGTVGTAVENLPVAWYTFDEQQREGIGFAGNWYDFTGDIFDDEVKTSFMRHALNGEFIGGQLTSGFSSFVETIAGYLQSNIDIGMSAGGGLDLRRVEGENIALDRPADLDKLTDGSFGTTYNYSSTGLGETMEIDLGSIKRVNKMTVFTGGVNPAEYVNVSFRGYSVEISLDEFRWEEVGIIHEIGPDNPGGYDNYSVEFPPEWVRYIRYRVSEARTSPPLIAEVMVYGEGHVTSAFYESDWLDLGSATALKNFGTVTWEGNVPDGTSITVQTRTKIGADAPSGEWSGWSPEMSVQEFEFVSPEPATHVQYRVNLSTQDAFITPEFKSFALDYSITNQPVATASGYVTPNAVAMGVDTTFTYVLDYSLLAGQNLKTVALSVPGFSTVESVENVTTGASLFPGQATVQSTTDTLYVSFTPALAAQGAAQLAITFSTAMYGTQHRFEGYLYNSTNNDNVGPIHVWENTSVGRNLVQVSSLIPDLISDVQAIPKVVSPNGDDINDFTVLEFTLAKIDVNVMINIYDTDGTLVRTLFDDYLGPRPYRVAHEAGNIAGAMQLPGYWDCTDGDGDLVPPGIYIYQIIADTDKGDVVEGGPVVVAY